MELALMLATKVTCLLGDMGSICDEQNFEMKARILHYSDLLADLLVWQ